MYQMTIKKNNKKRDIKIKHFRTFKVKFLGATNFKGERIKITDTRHKKSIIIGYDYSLRGTKEIAISELFKRGIKINSFSLDEKTYEYIFNSDDFRTPLK